MKKNILSFIVIITLFSCIQENNVKYTYYKSGGIKEKIVFKSANDYQAFLYSEDGVLRKTAQYKDGLLNGVCRTYNKNILIEEVSFENGMKNGKMIVFEPNGKIRMKRTYLNDTLQGITQLYDHDGKVKQEYFYINGKRIMYNDFYDNDSGKLTKKVNYCIESKSDSFIQKGQLVYHKKNKLPIKEMSFFYIIKHKKDTISMNDKNEMQIKFISKIDWKLEVQLGKMNELLSFTERPLIYRSNTDKVSFTVEPNHSGLNTVFGKLIISPFDKINLKGTHEFIIYDEYYAK